MDLVIFDLDGTLIDSKEDLSCAVNAARAHRSLAPLESKIVFSYVGEGAPVLIRRALGPGASDEEAADALKFFLGYYKRHWIDQNVLDPGRGETVGSLLAT